MKNRLLIKNMVCRRCVLSVEDVLSRLQIPFSEIFLGEVFTPAPLTPNQLSDFSRELRKLGFELIESRTHKLIADIKKIVVDYIQSISEGPKINLSVYITSKIPYDYSYLSDLFSSVESRSIEQYFIVQRIEKVKELIIYDQLSLTEISYRTGFSSVHHLSAQFRKVTGLTPSQFREIGSGKRSAIDSI